MAVDSSLGGESSLISASIAQSRSGGGNFAQLFRAAQARSGRSPISMLAEFWKLRRKPGRLSLPEYFAYNLYDDSLYDAAAKERFLRAGVLLHLVAVDQIVSF